MAHLLEQRIAAFRKRVRRLVVLHGLSTVVTAVLAALMLLGLADYLVHFEDRGLRVICWLTLVGVLGWVSYRYLYLPRLARLRDVDLALRLQARFPALDDRLVSAVEFLRQAEDDPVAGSTALRRAVITQSAAETAQIDFAGALDRHVPLRAALVALATGLVAAILSAAAPAATRMAVVRLLNPLGTATWPQHTHLALRQTIERVARGQAFEVEVIDAQGARLPAEVRIHYLFQDPEGKPREEVERMQLLAGAMVARRDNVTRSFEFRVEGGDDRSMPWLPVEVLEPPAVQSLEIELFPPAYTGRPSERLTAGSTVRALVGTRMRISGVATKPLVSAAIRLESGPRIPAQIAGDGLRFSVEEGLVIEKTGACWFELTDRDGLSGGKENRWEIRAVADSPPSVAIERPAGNLFVTPRAVVPLRVVAGDDLALKKVWLVFGPADKPLATQSSIDLYLGPPEAPRPAVQPAAAESGERRVLDYRWELAGLKLAPGTQIVFYAAASDYRPQTGKSEPLRMSVITPDELQVRIAARQGLLLAELARLLKIERDTRLQVQSLAIRAHETGGLVQVDVDRLQAAELNQRQVVRGLTSRADGVPVYVLALLADIENNRLDIPDFQRRMQALLAEIDRLDRQHLPVIGRALTAAIKASQIRLQAPGKPAAADAAVETSLAEAGQHQDQVLVSLETMLAQLRQWDDYRRFHRDITQLLHDQEELARNSAETGRQTLAKDLKDLAPQESADLKVLSGRQLELARRLDRLEQEMEQAVGELRPADPLAADTVADAVDEARRLGISAAMRVAGGQIQENRIGQTAAQHQQIVQDLQEVLDILANRRQQELTRLLKKYHEAERELEGIRNEQQRLRKAMEAAAGQKAELQRLGHEQEELRQRLQRLARRLERLQAEQAAGTARQADKQMGQVVETAGQGRGGDSTQQAREVEKTLEKLVQEVKLRRIKTQTDLLMEQLARLEDSLKHLRDQQKKVADETLQFDYAARQGPLGRTEATGLRELARFQQSLHDDTARLAESMKDSGGFHLALTAASGEMGRAGALLDRGQTGPATQQAQQNALTRLDLLLKALEPEKPAAKPGDDGSGDGGGGKQPPGQAGGVQTLAELKLLMLMQQDVYSRTRQLDEAAAAGKMTKEEHKQQSAGLSEEEGLLADMIFQLLKPKEDVP